MALWLLAINGLMFAILLLVILLPALHIHPLGLHPDDDEEPPRAGELVAGTHLRRTEKQKLYLLFIIPSCAIVNSVFLYLTYYRPIRFIQYRVEFNEVSLLTNRLLGQNKLMSIINANEHNRSASTINFNNASNFASPLMVLMRNNTTHLLSRHNSNDNNNNNNINTRVGGANSSSHAMGYANNSTTSNNNNNNNNNNSSSYSFNNTGSSYINTSNNNYYDNTLIGTIASQSFLKLNRHCRPKIVKKNEYVLKSIYPEVTELCRQVEKSFFIACTITERNFLTAIRKVLGPGVLREFTNHSLFGNSYLTMANYANVYGNGIGYNSSISKPTTINNNNNNNNNSNSNYVTKSYLDNSNSNANKLITYNGNTTSTSTNNTNTTTNSTLNNNINNINSNIDNININNVNSAGIHETNGTYERAYNSNNPPRHRFTFLDRIMRNNNNNNNDNKKLKNSNNKGKNTNTGVNISNDTFDEMSDFGLESATEAFYLGSHTANTNNHTQPFTGSHNKYYHGAHSNNHSSMNNTISNSNNNRLLHEPINDMNNSNAPTLHHLQSRDPSVVLLVPTREARHEGHIRNTMPAAIHPHELNNARSSQNKNSSNNNSNNTNNNGNNNIIDSPIRIVAEEPFAHE